MRLTRCTETTKGRIAHLEHPSLGFMMPVKLATHYGKVVIEDRKSKPLMSGDKFVYALPGGKEYVA